VMQEDDLTISVMTEYVTHLSRQASKAMRK